MNPRTRRSVLAVLLALGGALSAQAAPAGARAEPLRSELAPLAAMGAFGNGKMSFSLHNPGRSSLFLLRWQTPLDGITDDLFEVRLNGETGPGSAVRQFITGSPGSNRLFPSRTARQPR